MFFSYTTSPNPEKDLKEGMRKIVVAHVKARSRIVRVLGDLYYQEIKDKSPDEIVDQCFEQLPDNLIVTEKHLQVFLSKQIACYMPFSEPQWKVWIVKNFKLKEHDECRSVFIWKSHHNFGDGLSGAAMLM